jgi:hypothetical protein
MAKYLEEIFNECLERIRQGESIESCLSSYPEYADELEELLSTVLNVRWRASIAQPRPEFKARARAQFMGALQYARQYEQPKKPGIFSLQRAWVPALATVLILLFGTVGTAAASTDAMPDQPLYHVKLATEQVRLTFTFSDIEKVKYNVELAENRSQEIVYMAEQGDTEKVTAATERLSKHLQDANLVIARIEEKEMKEEAAQVLTSAPPPIESTTQPSRDGSKDTEPERFTAGDGEAAPRNSTVLKELVRESISRNVTSLDSALPKVPEMTRPAVQEAIDTSRELEPVVQERTRPETEQVPEQPERIESTRPDNKDTQSSTESKELEIQTRPKTEPDNSPTSSDVETKRIEESQTDTEDRDTSTNENTRDSSPSPTDGSSTDNRSSIDSLTSLEAVSTTVSPSQQLVTSIRK